MGQSQSKKIQNCLMDKVNRNIFCEIVQNKSEIINNIQNEKII